MPRATRSTSTRGPRRHAVRHQNAASSFSLNSGNTSPKDIVTDGTSLWVVNDSSTDKVFKYISGGIAGRQLDDQLRRRESHRDHARSGQRQQYLDRRQRHRSRVSVRRRRQLHLGQRKSPSTTFALAAGNTNPQGIADPPVRSVEPSAASTGVVHDEAGQSVRSRVGHDTGLRHTIRAAYRPPASVVQPVATAARGVDEVMGRWGSAAIPQRPSTAVRVARFTDGATTDAHHRCRLARRRTRYHP